MSSWRESDLIARTLTLCLVLLVATAGLATQSSAADAATLSWAPAVTVPTPSNAGADPEIAITSLSCPSSGNCSAIGGYEDTSGETQGLLATETNGRWITGAEAQLPSNALSTNPDVTLSSVACASAGNCTAVGGYLDSNSLRQGLLLTETGGIWAQGREVIHPQGVASVATNPQIDLTSVACASATNCFAAGTYTDSKGYPEGLLESEVNGTWSETEKNGHYSYTGTLAGLPGDAATEPDVALSSVSCGAVGQCVIVGSYLNSSSEQEPLLLTGSVSSGAWSFTATAAGLPSGAAASPGASLSSVSCSASGSCSAVGSYENASQHEQGLMVAQTSSTWRTGTAATLPADASSNPGVSLSSISCSSAGDCDAVGDYYTSSGNLQGLMLTANGGNWGSGAEPTLPSDADGTEFVSLASVSCSAASSCAVSGNYADASFSLHPLLLSQSSNGTWSAGTEPALPYPNGSPDASVEALSCAVGGDCAEVADYTDQANDQLAGATNGTTVPAALPTLALSAPPTVTETGTTLAADAVGATLSSGASATGAVTFSVFGPQASPPSSCAYGATTVGTTTVSGNGSYEPTVSFTPVSPGDYWWFASYSGDLNNASAASSCGALMGRTLVQSPTIAVTAPSTSTLNATISQTAVAASLSGVAASGGGSLTLTVFGPQASAPTNCSVGGTQIGSDGVHGNGSFNPASDFTAASVGDYWWYASYTGDASDPAAASSCGAQMAQTVVSAIEVSLDPPSASATAGSPVATPAKPPAAATATARISKVTSTATGLRVTLSCRASSHQSCAGAITATATEPGTARAKREKTAKRTRKRVVTIATVTYKLGGGKSRRVSIKLNRVGRKLLRSRHKLSALLKLRQGKTTVSRTVTVRA